MDIKVESLGLSRLKGLLLAGHMLVKKVAEIDPGLIHTHGIRADMLNASVLRGYPSLCTAHNYPYADYPSKFGKLRGRFMAGRHMTAFRQLNVIGCSLAIQRQLMAHGISAGVVQNGVDTLKFQPVCSTRKKALRQNLGLKENTNLFVSVGSLIPRKDMTTLIEAFVKSTLGDLATLVILGDGPQMTSLKSKSDANVHLLGNISSVDDFLSAADVFVSCALSEGLPNTVLEAMACGLPCLLSDIQPHRELFGGEGQYFPAGDVAALAQLINSSLIKENQELGLRSRQIIEESFSALRMTQGYTEIYKTLGPKRHRNSAASVY